MAFDKITRHHSTVPGIWLGLALQLAKFNSPPMSIFNLNPRRETSIVTMKVIFLLPHLYFFIIITTLSTVIQPTTCKDADIGRRPDTHTRKHTPTRQVPEWESPNIEYRCGLGATNPPSRDVITAAEKMLDMAATKDPPKALCMHTHADCTNMITHGSASIDYCGGSLGSRMYCETIAQMALRLASKCATPDGDGESRLHSGGMVLVEGHMRVTVY